MAIDIPKNIGALNDEDLQALNDSVLGLLLRGEIDEEQFNVLRVKINDEMKKRGIKVEAGDKASKFAQRKMKEIRSRLKNNIFTIAEGIVKVRSDVIGERCMFFMEEARIEDAFKQASFAIASTLADKKDHFTFSTRPGCSFDSPVFDLCLIPHGRDITFKTFAVEGTPEDVAHFHQLRKGSQQLLGAARSSSKRDEIIPGRFFKPRPFTRCVQAEAPQTVTDIAQSFSGKCNTQVVVRYSNVDVQIHKVKSKLRAWTSEAVDCTYALTKIFESLKTIKNDFVLLGNLQLSKGHIPLSTNSVQFRLEDPKSYSEFDLTLRVYDCFYDGDDIHGLTWSNRERHLLDIVEALPSDASVKLASMTHSQDTSSLVPTINHYKKKRDVSSVMAYPRTPYCLTINHGKGIPLYEKVVTFNAVVLETHKTNIKSVSNLVIGLDPRGLNFSDSDLVCINGKRYVQIGTTLSTSRWSYPGDIVEVTAQEIEHKYDPFKDINSLDALGLRVVNRVTSVGFPNLAKSVIEGAVDSGAYFNYVLVPGPDVRYYKDSVSDINPLKIFKWEQTDEEISYRVRPIKIFHEDAMILSGGKKVTFLIKMIRKSPRVEALVGKMADKVSPASSVQSLRFLKSEGWTLAKAQEWAQGRDLQDTSMKDDENLDGKDAANK